MGNGAGEGKAVGAGVAVGDGPAQPASDTVAAINSKIVSDASDLKRQFIPDDMYFSIFLCRWQSCTVSSGLAVSDQIGLRRARERSLPLALTDTAKGQINICY